MRGRFISLLCLILILGSAHAEDRGLHPVILQATTQDGGKISLYKESHALLIGVSDYAQWPHLNSIPSELDEVEQALKAHDFNVVRLKNPKSSELSDGIEDFIDEYGYERENRLLIYFSGHGHSVGEKGLLIPADSPLPDDINFRRKSVPMSRILSWARDMEAKHALFLFDSCFSGSVFNSRNLPGKNERYIRKATAEPVRQFITAGSANQVVPAKSTFTPALVRAIDGEGDLNNDGYVTGSELGVHLSQLVPQFTDQNPQYGKIKDYDLAQGDFVFFSSLDPQQSPDTSNMASVSEQSLEAVLWQSTELGNNILEYEAYVAQYPNGTFTRLAQARIDALKKDSMKDTTESLLPTIAVLPFDIVGEKSMQYLSRGISEGIIFALSRSPHIQVVPRTSSFAFERQESTAQQFGKHLGADYALEGTVQRGNESVRVISQLIEVETGFQLWTDSFDHESEDALAIQDTVAEKIMASLVNREEGAFRNIISKKAWLKETMELEEYDYMLRGHDYHLRWSRDNIAKALAIYEEGLERFPKSALLKVKIGWALYAQATQGWSNSPELKLERATKLAEEALAWDKAPLISDYLAHRLLGWLYSTSLQVERGLAQMEAAVSLVPGLGRARADLGSIQLFAGLIDEGLKNLELAEIADPAYPRIALYKAWGYRIRGDYRKAQIEAERYPIESIDKYLLLASSFQGTGEAKKAEASVAKAISIYPELSIASHRNLLPFTDDQFVERYLHDLSEAGLRE